MLFFYKISPGCWFLENFVAGEYIFACPQSYILLHWDSPICLHFLDISSIFFYVLNWFINLLLAGTAKDGIIHISGENIVALEKYILINVWLWKTMVSNLLMRYLFHTQPAFFCKYLLWILRRASYHFFVSFQYLW